jgi:hypothetical protein
MELVYGDLIGVTVKVAGTNFNFDISMVLTGILGLNLY